MATYKIRLRVTTWVARHDVPNVDLTSGGNTNLSQQLIDGFLNPYATAPGAGATAEFDDISNTLFQNPWWVQMFRAVKVRWVALFGLSFALIGPSVR